MEEVKKKKVSFVHKLKSSKTKQILFFVISMSLLFIIYFMGMEKLNQCFTIRTDDFSWVCQIDSIENIDNSIVLSGFSFLLGKNAEEETYKLILYDTKTGKGYYPKMEYEDREDVNRYFLCEYDYTKSGFKAMISSKKLDMENGVYEVLLKPIGSKQVYTLGIYYTNGEMYFTNPNEFEALDITGTDLEIIIEEGVLRAYQPNHGIYVYQYEGELYWIAEEWYAFNENNDTYIEFQMDTTQIQKLPENRLENNWFWSNLGFMFQSKELSDWNTGKYRVAKCTLPIEYSLTKIWTGNYNNGWIWKNEFRPWYEFGEE